MFTEKLRCILLRPMTNKFQIEEKTDWIQDLVMI